MAYVVMTYIVMAKREHVHDQTITSIGIDLASPQHGPVDLGLYQNWLDVLLREKGTDLFRMKGVLWVKRYAERYVFQAVHMIYKGSFTEPWGNQPRCSKLTLIGKNLDHEALRAGFMNCLATEANYRKYEDGLRFKVGDIVECNAEKGWSRGTIVKLGYTEPSFGPEFLAPYQVKLDNGRLIYCPTDSELGVRLAPSKKQCK